MRTRFSTRQLAALFFLLIMLADVLTPTVAYALTAGPTAPEATSFEPVDTTDAVNTITGDFVYNMPLLEVPGPAGSYHLSLSYHAGIQPNVEASWVGLGWSLNPGAINRIVNGLPDDYDGVSSISRVFWEGGEYKESRIGISYGIANFATVSAGLSFATDTYKGRGVGGYLGANVGVGFGKDSPASAKLNLQVGIAPFSSNIMVSGGVNIGIGGSFKALSGTAGVGLSFNSKGNVAAGLSGGVSAMAMSWQGSISTTGSQASLGIAGIGISTRVNNSRDGITSTMTDDWSIDIPVGFGVNLNIGRTYVRYWMDEKQTLTNYGSLYFPRSTLTSMSTKVFDSYHLPSEESIASGKDPGVFANGSFADYDVYNVSAQGVGGSFRPYHYALSLYSQDIVKEADGSKEVLHYGIPQHSVGVHYRFTNDFSNRVLNETPPIEILKSVQDYQQSPRNAPTGRRSDPTITDWESRLNEYYPSSTTPIPLFFNLGDIKTGIEGYEMPGTKRRIPHVPGSRHIDFFTNNEIIDARSNQSARGQLRDRGFLECRAQGYVRSVTDGKVGAFSITNSSGVTYHFSLPAYAYDEHIYQQNKDTQQKTSFNNLSQAGRYAYTWYLTAVTGPDYVDRGPTGSADYILNEYDWGYWVEFNYGMWSSNYRWRNPSSGFNEDIDNNFQSFSKGKKEVYYLNYIRTATHTAMFVKDIRADAKSTTSEHDVSVKTSSGHHVSWLDDGGHDVVNRSVTVLLPPFYTPINLLNYPEAPVASMSLNSVLLFDNKDLSSQLESYFSLDQRLVDRYRYTNPQTGAQMEVRYHDGNNVLDVYDVNQVAFPKSRSLRVIDLGYDYSLCPGTINSFDPAGNLYSGAVDTGFIPNQASMAAKEGKLTLKSIEFKGKSAQSIMPKTHFEYELSNEPLYSGSMQYNTSNREFTMLSNSLNASTHAAGDLVKFNLLSNVVFGYVTQVSTGQLKVKMLTGNVPAGATSFSGLVKTKNPPYHSKLVDMWGYYKMDFNESDPSNIANYPSIISAKNTDVWSLRQIRTSTGASIRVDYESDTYGENGLENLTLKAHPYTGSGYTGCFPQGSGYTAQRVAYEITNGGNSNIDFTKMQFPFLELAADIKLCVTMHGSYSCSPLPAYTTRQYFNIETLTPDRIVASLCVSFIQINNATLSPAEGTAFVKSSRLVYGGGLRVKRLRVSDVFQQVSRSTDYVYDFDGSSSGSTSYEPGKNHIPKDASIELKRGVINPLIKVLSLAREIPAPGVYYGKVRIQETMQGPQGQATSNGYTDYEFDTFDAGLVGIETSSSDSRSYLSSHLGMSYNEIVAKKMKIKDYTQRLGNLRSVTLYDPAGNKISETRQHYLHDEQTAQSFSANSSEYQNLTDRFANQGVIHEAFNHARWVRAGNVGKLLGVISVREAYPSISTGSTSVNFKTGVKTETRNLAFDFYNGQPTKTFLDDGYGNRFVTESRPAYLYYPAMGLKAYHANSNQWTNRHMIEQVAYEETYRANPTNLGEKLDIVAASAQTWSNQSHVTGVGTGGVSGIQANIWRKKANYVFIGNVEQAMAANGLIAASSFTPFTNWTTGEPPSQWQKTSEVTLYDPNSHAIEAKDINENFAATKFTSDHSQVIASAANARYTEFAYCGGEENTTSAGGGVTVNGTRVPTAHTGSFGVQAAVNSRAFSFTLTPTVRDYVVNVWATQPDAFVRFKVGTVTSTATTQRLGKAGNWHLLQATFTATSTQPIEVWVEAKGATTQFDDFRVHPLTGPMTSYVYNSFGELSHILDASNLFTEFRYDAMGRLTQTYRETLLGPGDQPRYGANGIAKVSDIQYNYGKNSPYQVNLTVSQTGGSGSVSPIGSVPVEQGETQTIRIQESCAAPQVRWVYVDNVQYPTNASFTLFDGCSVSITPGSVRLANVRAPHEIRVEFNTFMSDAGYRCHMVNVGGGQQCPSGLFEYGTPDQCGNVTWVQSSWRGPGNAPNCCDLQPSGSNCHCGQVEN